MASISKRGNSYSVRWRDPDGTSRRRKAPTHTVACQLKREIENATALGRRWEPGETRGVPGLTGKTGWIKKYLDDQRRLWAPQTFRVREVELSVFESWLINRIRRTHIHVSFLNRDLIRDFWTHCVEDRRVSPHSATQYARHIEHMWRWIEDEAAEHGWEIPRFRKLRFREVERPKIAAPTWAQMDNCIAHARRENWRRLLTLLRFTGLRGKSQAMHLLWDDVDLEAATLRLRPELGKSKQERRGRTIAISPHLATEMAGWGRREGYLIPWAKQRCVIQEVANGYWRASGAPSEVWRQPLHSFRHGVISGLYAIGAHPEGIKAMVGHTRGTTGDVYAGAASDLSLTRLVVDKIPPICRPPIQLDAERLPGRREVG
jgi:hypothetical protein